MIVDLMITCVVVTGCLCLMALLLLLACVLFRIAIDEFIEPYVDTMWIIEEYAKRRRRIEKEDAKSI